MARELEWREVGMPALNSSLSSGTTSYIPPELRPEWCQLPQVTGAWLYYEGGAPAETTGSLSTIAANA